MEFYLVIGGIISISIAIFGFIIPAVRCAKRILKSYRSGEKLALQRSEKVGLFIMPFLGYASLYLFKEDVELLDWSHAPAIWVLTGLSHSSYFLSRLKKDTIGPLVLVIIPGALTIGIALALAQFIHFLPIVALGSMFIPVLLGIFVLPAFSLLQAVILLSTELYCVLQFNKNKILNAIHENDLAHKLANLYFGKYYLISQIITFPLFVTLIQYILILFTQRPDSLIQAFIESHDGLFSHGRCDHCSSYGGQDYICTIAGFGNEKIVKPIHYGYRHGILIRVNRQLKVCNAFEQIMEEKIPTIHKYLRSFYDSLQIPIEKWKKVKPLANSLYLLIKPMEWTFLIIIYLFEKDPETRIARQYLPSKIIPLSA